MPLESIWDIPMELITLRLSFQLIPLCQTEHRNSEKGDFGSILNGRIAMVVEVEVGVEVEEEVQSEKISYQIVLIVQKSSMVLIEPRKRHDEVLMVSKSLQFCWSSLMRSLETSDFRLEISCDGRSRFSAVCCFRSWGHYPVSKKESTHPPTHT